MPRSKQFTTGIYFPLLAVSVLVLSSGCCLNPFLSGGGCITGGCASGGPLGMLGCGGVGCADDGTIIDGGFANGGFAGGGCSDGCSGGGLAANYPGGCGTCASGCGGGFSGLLLPLLSTKLACGSGCGDIYWNEWMCDPPDCCDPCDDYGCWVGQQTCPGPPCFLSTAAQCIGSNLSGLFGSVFGGLGCGPCGMVGGAMGCSDTGVMLESGYDDPSCGFATSTIQNAPAIQLGSEIQTNSQQLASRVGGQASQIGTQVGQQLTTQVGQAAQPQLEQVQALNQLKQTQAQLQQAQFQLQQAQSQLKQLPGRRPNPGVVKKGVINRVSLMERLRGQTQKVRPAVMYSPQ